MAKRLVTGLLVIFAATALFLFYRWYDRLQWLDASVRVHSERDSTNCGHLTNSGYEAHPDSATVIRCVESAHQQHRVDQRTRKGTPTLKLLGHKSACGAWANYLVIYLPKKVEFCPP